MEPDRETDDLVDVLVADHRTLLALLDHAAAADHSIEHPRLARMVRRHCATEERLLHPLLRRCLPDGARGADSDAEEHEQLDDLADQLLDTTPGSPDAHTVLRSLAGATRSHIEGVETRRLPQLRRCLTSCELHTLAREARAALRSDHDSSPTTIHR